MFISKITICNLFAYYGKVEVEFKKVERQNLYCIYGNNGFGKTSFIRCAKLLFLGVGVMNNEISPVIARFAPKGLSSSQFIKGIGEKWLGILNKPALQSLQEEFYIIFEGTFEGKRFHIKRSFENIYESIEEHLSFSLDNESFTSEEAQERINKIMPPNLIEFFFFDGEELEKISENLRKGFREKIEDILQIKPLDIAINQIQKYKTELRDNENKNKDNASLLAQKRKDKESKEIGISHLKGKIKDCEKEIEEKSDLLSQKIRQIDKLGSDFSREKAELVSEKDMLDSELIIHKENFKESVKGIIFAANEKLIKDLNEEIARLETSKSKQDIESYKKLLPELKELTKEELKHLEMPEYFDVFDEILENLPQKLEQKSFSHSFITSAMLLPLKENLARIKHIDLAKDIDAIKHIKNKLYKNKTLQDELISDEDIRGRQELLEKEKQTLHSEKQQKEKEKENLKDELRDLENLKENIDREIYFLDQNINTERIDNKLKILESLQKSIEKYKEKLTHKLRGELHSLILKNYQSLLSNDNVRELKIDEDFEIELKDENDEQIIVENQSSGQKQILAIAIFWALSKLSKSNLPIIIDTPLGRIDSENRKNIIQNYYANNVQVILLPLDSEIGLKEYEYAKPHLAGLYKIENPADRHHAFIKKADIKEIL